MSLLTRKIGELTSYRIPKADIMDTLNRRFKAVSKREQERLRLATSDFINWAHNNENLKETFDLTGKSNPQAIRYERWGKFLQNKYGGKRITD